MYKVLFGELLKILCDFNSVNIVGKCSIDSVFSVMLNPVSYTHLDVYKRQINTLAMAVKENDENSLIWIVAELK